MIEIKIKSCGECSFAVGILDDEWYKKDWDELEEQLDYICDLHPRDKELSYYNLYENQPEWCPLRYV